MDEHLIAGIMTVGVIDSLEVIHIHHDQGYGLAIQGVPRNLVLEEVEEEAAVIDAGELVFKD